MILEKVVDAIDDKVNGEYKLDKNTADIAGIKGNEKEQKIDKIREVSRNAVDIMSDVVESSILGKILGAFGKGAKLKVNVDDLKKASLAKGNMNSKAGQTIMDSILKSDPGATLKDIKESGEKIDEVIDTAKAGGKAGAMFGLGKGATEVANDKGTDLEQSDVNIPTVKEYLDIYLNYGDKYEGNVPLAFVEEYSNAKELDDEDFFEWLSSRRTQEMISKIENKDMMMRAYRRDKWRQTAHPNDWEVPTGRLPSTRLKYNVLTLDDLKTNK